MELLLPKRFLALLVVLAALAGAVYLADGQRRAAVMDTVWGLADRVAALIVPGEVEEAAMVGAGGQAGRLARLVATATFTPPVMPAVVFERERARERTPTATPTPMATPTPAPTPTPLPMPEPEAGQPTVQVQLQDKHVVVRMIIPPVRYTWYEYSGAQWHTRTALVTDSLDLNTLRLTVSHVVTESAITPIDLDHDLLTTDVTIEAQVREDAAQVIRIEASWPITYSGTYRVLFSAFTEGTYGPHGVTTPPREIHGETIVHIEEGE